MTMYYSYFNLDKTTFASAPNPKSVFKATSFLAARSQLVNGFRLGKRIGIVTGKAGIGKTALTCCRDHQQSYRLLL